MQIDRGVSLKPYNTFGLPAVAQTLVRIASDADVRRVVDDPVLGLAPKFILGGGSNIILTRDMPQIVLKVEVRGMRVLEERADAWIVEAGAGENWHDFVEFTLAQGCPGWRTWRSFPAPSAPGRCRTSAPTASSCRTGSSRSTPSTCSPAAASSSGRDLRLRLSRQRLQACARRPQPDHPGALSPAAAVAAGARLSRAAEEDRRDRDRVARPRQIFDWVASIRRAKLPDPAAIGNAGSFFKNPVVTPEQCRDIIGRDPEIVHYPMPDGSVKLAAAWMIDACGWKGKSVGGAGVYEKQALVLVNRGAAIGSEVMTLALAIQESVYGRFGIRLEPEPVVV
jgi:UDP-N-acetylmuramate dehydrogenase